MFFCNLADTSTRRHYTENYLRIIRNISSEDERSVQIGVCTYLGFYSSLKSTIMTTLISYNVRF